MHLRILRPSSHKYPLQLSSQPNTHLRNRWLGVMRGGTKLRLRHSSKASNKSSETRKPMTTAIAILSHKNSSFFRCRWLGIIVCPHSCMNAKSFWHAHILSFTAIWQSLPCTTHLPAGVPFFHVCSRRVTPRTNSTTPGSLRWRCTKGGLFIYYIISHHPLRCFQARIRTKQS